MKYSILFIALGILVTLMGVEEFNHNFVIIWTGISIIILGLSYGINSPFLFGKKPDGSRGIIWLVLFPWIAFTTFVWHIKRLISKEPIFNQINDQMIIGRRPLEGELPENVKCVVDMTCEFPAAQKVIANVDYICIPTLDASVPNIEKLKYGIEKVLEFNELTYVHCAEGHGRSLIFCLCLLLTQNRDTKIDEALKQVKDARPLVRLNKNQRKFVEKFLSFLTDNTDK